MSENAYRHSARTRQILWVLAPITCPPDLVRRGLLDPVIDDLEKFMGIMPPPIRAAMLLGMNVFDLTATLDPRNAGKAFSQLDGERARRWFDLWWHSPVALMREFAKKTKGLLVLCYYERPAVRMQMDYNPDQWIAKVAKERLERFGEEIRRKEAETTVADPLPASMIELTQEVSS